MWLASRLEQEQEAERPAVTQDDVFDNWVSLSVTDSRTEKNKMIYFYFFLIIDFFFFFYLSLAGERQAWEGVGGCFETTSSLRLTQFS